MGPPPHPSALQRAWHCPASPGIIPELVGGSSLDKNERKKKIPPVAKSVLLFGFRATVQLPPDAPKMISLLTILNYNS